MKNPKNKHSPAQKLRSNFLAVVFHARLNQEREVSLSDFFPSNLFTLALAEQALFSVQVDSKVAYRDSIPSTDASSTNIIDPEALDLLETL